MFSKGTSSLSMTLWDWSWVPLVYNMLSEQCSPPWDTGARDSHKDSKGGEMVLVSRAKPLRSLGHRLRPCKRRFSEARWHLEGFRVLRKIFGHTFSFMALYALRQSDIRAVFFFPSSENEYQNLPQYFSKPAPSSSLPAARNQSSTEWQIHLPLRWHPFLHHH